MSVLSLRYLSGEYCALRRDLWIWLADTGAQLATSSMSCGTYRSPSSGNWDVDMVGSNTMANPTPCLDRPDYGKQRWAVWSRPGRSTLWAHPWGSWGPVSPWPSTLSRTVRLRYWHPCSEDPNRTHISPCWFLF